MTHFTHEEWCRWLFNSLADGAVWGVPRSGVIFRRQGDELVEVERMPWEEGMPITAEQLQQQQDGEFASVKENFEAAGISVRKREEGEPGWLTPDAT